MPHDPRATYHEPNSAEQRFLNPIGPGGFALDEPGRRFDPSTGEPLDRYGYPRADPMETSHRYTAWDRVRVAARDDMYLHALVTRVEGACRTRDSVETLLIDAVLALAKNNKELRDLATEYLTTVVPRILVVDRETFEQMNTRVAAEVKRDEQDHD